MRQSIRKAFIRKHRDIPFSEAGFTLWHGLLEKGVEVEGYTGLDNVLSSVAADTLVHGGVEDVRRALKHLGVADPNLPSLPVPICHLMGRDICEMSLRDARNRVTSITSPPYFMKPLEQKLFTGHIVHQMRDLIQTAHVPEETRVYVQDVVRFASEWRVFVHNDIAIGMKHYAGDFKSHPDISVAWVALDLLIRRQPMLPVSFSIDLGVLLDTGETVVVEVNDAFALGPYGLAWSQYVPLVVDRWLELTGDPIAQAHEEIRRYGCGETSYHQFWNRFIPRYEAAHTDPHVADAHLFWCEHTTDRERGSREDMFRRDIRGVWSKLSASSGRP